jgi:RNA polymerase sigma-70 factor (ECF subfamily)
LPRLSQRAIIEVVDEPQLLSHAQQGDLDSFNRLVLAHQERAFNLAYRILGETAAASDATQQAFLSVFRNLRSYRGGSFRSWVLRIVTNACYDELRRRKRRPAISLEELGDGEAEGETDAWERLAVDPEAGPEDAVLQRERVRAIESCLEGLPLDFRTVAILSDVQGLPYEEIAVVIRAPVGTVKSRLARARARLRDCLERHGELFGAGRRLTDRALP